MPPASPTQSIDCARASDDAPTSRPKSASSRTTAFLPPAFASNELPTLMSALVPLTDRLGRAGGPRPSMLALDSGGPAVVEPLPGPVRPVTLRHHLSVALPLSKSLCDQPIGISSCDPNHHGYSALRSPAGSRSGTKSSRPSRLPWRRN